MRNPFVLFLVTLTACAAQAAGSPGSDAGGVDASASSDTGVDGGFVCGSGADAGASSLATLPVASLCAQSQGTSSPSLTETTCGSLVWVTQPNGGTCYSFWVFDATSGVLDAFGGGCDGVSCKGGAPGFRFPSDCDPGHCSGCGAVQELCAGDAGGAGG